MTSIEINPKTYRRIGRYGTMNDTIDSVLNKMMNYLNPDHFVQQQFEEEWEDEWTNSKTRKKP